MMAARRVARARRSVVRDSEPVNTYAVVGRFDRPSAGGARVGAGGVDRAATERLDDAAIDEDPCRVVHGTGYGDHRTLLIAFDQSKDRRPTRNDLEGVLLPRLRTGQLSRAQAGQLGGWSGAKVAVPDEQLPRKRQQSGPTGLNDLLRSAADLPGPAPQHGSVGARQDLRCVKGRRSEEHTSELQSRQYLVCRLLLEKKKKKK